MRNINYYRIIRKAWKNYGSHLKIRSIMDVSVMVSTNHVFRMKLEKGATIFAKVSFFGRYEHFHEDHQIINVLANNLRPPYENFLAKSLTKDDKVFTFRYSKEGLDAWVVFYQAIDLDQKLPKKQPLARVSKLGEELAKFHLACYRLKDILPSSSKDLDTDINSLLHFIDTDEGEFAFGLNVEIIREQCRIFVENIEKLQYSQMERIPVFLDWNIGNFSITKDGTFYSRWDYDWFRMSSRTLDFYFFSRVISDAGDQSVFSFTPHTLMEDRFLLFLEAYHKIFPLMKNEILFIGEAYRFFILNYIIKEGMYFYHHIYAPRLQKEAFDDYFRLLKTEYSPDPVLNKLSIT